jgi:hypothetical protein
MIRIDDSLLEELGLMSLPKEERDAMLRQIYETLEMRVGMKLAERMNDQQLDEFERFIDGDTLFTENYLTTTKPGWQQSEEYKTAIIAAQNNAQKQGIVFNENSVKSEFGALTWLETNFPDYKQVVATELDKLKGEIKQDSNKIIEATQGQAMPQMPVANTPQPQQQNVAQPDFSQPTPQPQVPQNPTEFDQQPPMAA